MTDSTVHLCVDAVAADAADMLSKDLDAGITESLRVWNESEEKAMNTLVN
jgi:hypothetical protein